MRDMLLGNIKNKFIRTREIKNIMKVSSKEIAKATGIPLTRLMEIDAGENATLAEFLKFFLNKKCRKRYNSRE